MRDFPQQLDWTSAFDTINDIDIDIRPDHSKNVRATCSMINSCLQQIDASTLVLSTDSDLLLRDVLGAFALHPTAPIIPADIICPDVLMPAHVGGTLQMAINLFRAFMLQDWGQLMIPGDGLEMPKQMYCYLQLGLINTSHKLLLGFREVNEERYNGRELFWRDHDEEAGRILRSPFASF